MIFLMVLMLSLLSQVIKMTEHSEEFIETYERAAKALRENDKETTLQIIKEAREEQINLSAKIPSTYSRRAGPDRIRKK